MYGPAHSGPAVDLAVALPPKNTSWPGLGLLDIAGLADPFPLHGHVWKPLGVLLSREGYKDMPRREIVQPGAF